MKKLLFMALVVLSLLSFVVPVRAMETNAYSGTAQSGKPFVVEFITYRTGDISVLANFVPSNQRYSLDLEYYASGIYDPAEPPDISCHQLEDARWGRYSDGLMDCSIASIPSGGLIRVAFWVVSGKKDVTLTITAETNP